MAIASSPRAGSNPLLTVAAVCGVLGMAAVFIAKAQGSALASQSYLMGFLMWMVLTLGCLGLTILINLVRGRWGYPILAFVSAGARLLPLMAILFVPILAFLPDVYPWARPGDVAANPVLQHREAFLNPWGFAFRAAIYFGLWIGISILLARWSRFQEVSGDPNWERKRMSFSAPAAILFVLSVTLAVTDWIMSLEAHWYSTIFGLLFVAGEALTALALAIAYLAYTSGGEALKRLLKPRHFHDLGTLLFTLVVFWAYLAFSQFIIIWSADLPEEITYYAARQEGAWSQVGMAVMFLHFLLPFLILLSARVKRTPKLLGAVAIGILAMRVLEMLWAVAPSLHRTGSQLSWTDGAAFLGIGGIWVAVFVWQLSRSPAPPRYAMESLELEHV
jgi:hypothetical protein